MTPSLRHGVSRETIDGRLQICKPPPFGHPLWKGAKANYERNEKLRKAEETGDKQGKTEYYGLSAPGVSIEKYWHIRRFRFWLREEKTTEGKGVMIIGEENRTDDVREGLRRIAFGSAADAVKLLLRGEELSDRQIKKLDLFNVAALKRSAGGITEVKFFDRIKAMEFLSRGPGEKSSQNDFIEALRLSAAGGEEE